MNLKFPDYEILILPDRLFPQEDIFLSSKIRIIPTGNVTPPYKRDLGAKAAKGEILAFLDDDAYPKANWLGEAAKIFAESSNIACVCGPAVTPEKDSLKQKASGLVYSSIFISGNHKFRYLAQSRREVSDFPSCNFLIRKDVFDEVGGFDKPFWPGEDTFLCLKVLNTGKKMIYDPKVLVFHHRRTLFGKHLNQIKNYALHRGYFVKKYSKTSLCPEYFVPSIFVLGLFFGFILSWPFLLIRYAYSIFITTYLILIFPNSLWLALKSKDKPRARILLFPLTFLGIISTHLTYGFYFMKGLLAKKMPEE